MRKRTKLLALLLGCSMTVGTLAGCSSETASEPAAQESKEESSAAAEETAAASAETAEAAEETGIDTSEKLTYKVVVSTNSSMGDWNEMYLFTHMEELYNIDLEIEMISSDVWGEKEPLLFASGDLPDLFLFGLGDDDVSLYGDQGFFLDLKDYFSEELTPNISRMIEANPEILAACTELNGSVYGMYGLDLGARHVLSKQFFYINTDWAQQILGKNPETVDEFYEYLVGVKENDMDGDGDPNNEIPFGGRYLNTNSQVYDPLCAMLPAYGFVDPMKQVMDDGSVVFVPAQDNYKELLKFMNKLYTEELVDQEMFTQTEEEYKAKDAANLYGAFTEWSAMANGRTLEEAYSYDMFPPMTSDVNDEQMWPALDLKKCGKFVISSTCENPERLLNAVDYFFSRENSFGWKYGWEVDTNPEYPGYGYVNEWNEDKTGVITTWVGPEGTYEEGASPAPEGWDDWGTFRFNKIGPAYERTPIYVDYDNLAAEGTITAWLVHNVMDNVYDYYRVAFPSSVKYTSEENSELNLIETDLRAYKGEMETKMIMGELDIDSTWDTYLEGLEARGMSRYVEIQQTAYDRYVANQQ
ncbi:MAG: extracellular solute-binding protein [Lachnospiraceae bacterium]|nr:extracellular solute-binding protein [Lachnospiraceae bacterium]